MNASPAWVAMTVPVLVGSVWLLTRTIRSLVQRVRSSVAASVPVREEQTVTLEAPGTYDLWVEGKPLSADFAALEFTLEDGSGAPVPLRSVWFRTTASSLSRVRLLLGQFSLAEGGQITLGIRAIKPGQDAGERVVFARPVRGAVVGYVLALVGLAFLTVASLVGTVLLLAPGRPSPPTVGERDLWVGMVSAIQTHGSLVNWHPHRHVLVTDGGFRPDGTFVHLPLHDVATLTEAFRRAVLRLFVRRGLMEHETALGILAWPHSGFHVRDAVWVPADDRAFALRLARHCARNPVALGRLAYPASSGTVTDHSDKSSGPTAGAETVDALEFLARLVSHMPDKGQVLQRSYGLYANRTRGMRRHRGIEAHAPVLETEPGPAALREARRRWAQLLRRIFEVDPLPCPRCSHAMRIVAFITQPEVIDRILTHLPRTAPGSHRPRAPPRHWTSPRAAASA